jgi:hypothetical protein
MSRRVFLLGVGIVLVALVFVGTDWALGLLPGITKTNAQRIRARMTFQEVEDLLGPFPIPANATLQERNEAKAFLQRIRAGDFAEGEFAIAFWHGEEGSVRVFFGSTGRVQSVGWHPANRDRGPNLLGRLRDWLGW